MAKLRTKRITITALSETGTDSLRQRVVTSLNRYDFKLGMTQEIIDEVTDEVTDDLVYWVEELLRDN